MEVESLTFTSTELCSLIYFLSNASMRKRVERALDSSDFLVTVTAPREGCPWSPGAACCYLRHLQDFTHAELAFCFCSQKGSSCCQQRVSGRSTTQLRQTQIAPSANLANPTPALAQRAGTMTSRDQHGAACWLPTSGPWSISPVLWTHQSVIKSVSVFSSILSWPHQLSPLFLPTSTFVPNCPLRLPINKSYSRSGILGK